MESILIKKIGLKEAKNPNGTLKYPQTNCFLCESLL